MKQSVLTDAKDLPNHVIFLALAVVIVTLRLSSFAAQVLPVVAVAVVMALWAVVVYGVIAVVYLRSDPRVWQPRTDWYRKYVAPLPAPQQAEVAQAVQDSLAPRLRLELAVMAGVGAAIGTIGEGWGWTLGAALIAAAGTWWGGWLVGLHSAANNRV